MKQLIFFLGVTVYFGIRSLVDPFWGLLLYYGFAVLRPQFLWNWALPVEIRWSLIAAVVAWVSYLLNIGLPRRRVCDRYFFPMVIGLGVLILASISQALNSEIAVNAGWEVLKILIMMLLGGLVITERRHVRYLGWMIFACLIYLVWEVNSMYLFEHRLDVYNRGFGGLDNNGAGLLFAMAIPFCYYFFYAQRRWWRWGFLLCIPPAIHAVMLTYSRGAMVSALAVGVAILLMSSRRYFFRTVALGVAMGVIILALAGPQVRARFWSIQRQEQDASIQSRFTSWKAGLAMARDYPILGLGPRNSNLLSKAYGCDVQGRTIHNVYIQLAADLGIPAVVLYVSLLIHTLWQLHRAARMSRTFLDDPSMRWHHYIVRGAFWSLVTFCIGSMFLSVETVELCYLLMLIGAVAPALAEPEDRKVGSAAPVKEIPVRLMGRAEGLT
jgi:probable O-glycosylation ligase (exosortase A-associated)